MKSLCVERAVLRLGRGANMSEVPIVTPAEPPVPPRVASRVSHGSEHPRARSERLLEAVLDHVHNLLRRGIIQDV